MMEKTLFTKEEVAARLLIGMGTLATYGTRYPVYRADNAGVFHVEHVRILEKVRAKILSPDEGLALWQNKRLTIRYTVLGALDVNGKAKSRRKGRKAN